MLTLRSFVRRGRRQPPADLASSAAGVSPSVADGGTSPLRHEEMTVDVSLPAKWGRYLSGINARRREEGTFAALKLGTAWGASFVKRQISAARDRAYDKRTGLDTVADHPGLEFPDGVAYTDAVYYARISPRAFAKAMKDVPVTPAEYTFIDLGCGKGAALLLALDRGFRSLVGIEANSRLAAIAEQNTQRYIAARGFDSAVEIIRGDVVDFRFPGSASVVYLYNPFGPQTLKAVLGNLERSLRETPRDVVVAYFSPAHRSHLDECGFLERLPARSRKWVMYRARTTLA